MKRSNHESYSDAQEALVALTKTCFKTGDVIIKEFRDKLEEYLDREYLIEPSNYPLIGDESEDSSGDEVLGEEIL